MRVAFITDIMTPYMAPVFEALAARCDLTVFFGSRTGSRAMAWSMREPSFRYSIVGGPAVSRRVDAADIHPSPRVLLELWRTQPEVVISSGFSFPSLYAAAYCRVRGARLLIQSDGTRASESALGREQRATRAALARAAHGAIGNSTPAVERLVELGFHPVHLAPHTSNLEPFLAVGRQRRASHDGPMRVAAVSRLLENKGHDHLLRGVAAARAAGAEIAVTVAGDGPDGPRLRALARDLGLTDVEWLGFVEPDDLPRTLARADAFAFSTLGDTFGIALLEAAAAGLPLVTSPYAGAARDLVQGRGTGFVVEPRDTSELAAKLAVLGADPALRCRMGQAAHALAATRTPSDAAQAYLEAAVAVARG